MNDELKTLKDMNCSDSNEYPCCENLDVKDMATVIIKRVKGKDLPHAVNVNELRQEAIKWIKEFFLRIHYQLKIKWDKSFTLEQAREYYKQHSITESMDTYCEVCDLVKFWMKRFNITEEDLK